MTYWINGDPKTEAEVRDLARQGHVSAAALVTDVLDAPKPTRPASKRGGGEGNTIPGGDTEGADA